jgi:hypothetical protein
VSARLKQFVASSIRPLLRQSHTTYPSIPARLLASDLHKLCVLSQLIGGQLAFGALETFLETECQQPEETKINDFSILWHEYSTFVPNFSVVFSGVSIFTSTFLNVLTIRALQD